MLLLYEANPIFSAPPGLRIREALAKIPYIVSFGSFIDETSAQADLILPDHAPLESWLDSTPESGSMQTVVNLSPPAVLPLHDTRSMPDVLAWRGPSAWRRRRQGSSRGYVDAMVRAALFPFGPAPALSMPRRTMISGTLRRPRAAGGARPPTAAQS